MKYVAKCEGVPIPFLPVHTVAEKKKYNSLLLEHLRGRNSSVADFDELALIWCDHVDGINIFPKLPVYLKTYQDTFIHNQNVRLAVQSARESAKLLSDLNKESARYVPAALPVLPRPPIISIVESDHTSSSTEAILVSGINLNTNNDNTSTKSAGSKRGRPLGAVNKEPSIRTCKNCQYYSDFEQATVCPGKMSSTGCT